MKKILVTGATGRVGEEVVKVLLDKKIQVKVGVRNLTKIQNKSWASHVEMVTLDYEHPESLKNALVNVEKIFLLTPSSSCREKEIAESVLQEGEKQGLQHIVRLSSTGSLFASHRATDILLMASSIDYTSLQPNTFMQNFYKQISIKTQKKIVEPAGDGKTSFIDVRDIAAVAATALINPGHANKSYTLTGSEALSYYQVADLFSNVLGQKITYQPLPSQDYIVEKIAEGMPVEFAERAVQFFQDVCNGEYAEISPAVEKILDRPPITLRQFISDYREKFI